MTNDNAVTSDGRYDAKRDRAREFMEEGTQWN